MKMKNDTKLMKQILKSQQGFSLIEILIGLSLLAIAGTFVVGKIFDQLSEGKVSAARIQINSLKDRLNEFRRHCNYYPTTEQKLDALVEKPTTGKECKRYAPNGYIDGGEIPLDPWDNEYDYKSDGKKYTIVSFGEDGVEGGDGFDTDISNVKK
ncbi:MAG: type II secretion system major pseudopilin GspG [Bacteriovoracaceae bacterium]|nr:type II secretion system major pseudopilin GspG [Bacteriovoracaceae bacterium]